MSALRGHKALSMLKSYSSDLISEDLPENGVKWRLGLGYINTFTSERTSWAGS